MHIGYFLYVCIYVHYVLVLGSEVSACLEGFFYTILREPLGVRCRESRGSGGMYW